MSIRIFPQFSSCLPVFGENSRRTGFAWSGLAPRETAAGKTGRADAPVPADTGDECLGRELWGYTDRAVADLRGQATQRSTGPPSAAGCPAAAGEAAPSRLNEEEHSEATGS
jgi:hypothetical protein